MFNIIEIKHIRADNWTVLILTLPPLGKEKNILLQLRPSYITPLLPEKQGGADTLRPSGSRGSFFCAYPFTGRG